MKKIIILFITSVYLYSNSINAQSYIIPDKETYHEFLIEPWKADAPSVVVFKDPYCPYCIKALKKLDRLKRYNVFMFWSPILGNASVNYVEDIFHCDQPIGSDVFTDVIARKPVSCSSAKKSFTERVKTKQLNDALVNNYDPQSVPSYYFGGKKVYLGSLNQFKKYMAKQSVPIKLDWSRYQSLKLDADGHEGLINALVFSPETLLYKQHFPTALKKDVRYSWYIADVNCFKFEDDCLTDIKYKRTAELKMLFGLEQGSIREPVFVINGKILKPDQYQGYFNEAINMFLASQNN